jgi:hypothetical protein
VKFWVRWTIERTSKTGECYTTRMSRLHNNPGCVRLLGNRAKRSMIGEIEIGDGAREFLSVCEWCRGTQLNRAWARSRARGLATCMRLEELILAAGPDGSTLRELRSGTGLTANGLWHAARRLAKAGVVIDKRRVGRVLYWRIRQPEPAKGRAADG